MMERLRAGANSLAVKIILGLIILSFVFAGVGSYIIGDSVEAVAVVGGQEISQAEFEQAYQNEAAAMQEQVGEVFTSLLGNPSYQAQFRASVLDKIVNQTLLDQYTESLGLRASEEQIKEAIRSMPGFSNNGIFNNDAYLAALRRSGLVPAQFAEMVRQDLGRQYLIQALESSEFSLPNEVNALHQLVSQTRTVRLLTLPLTDFTKNVVLTEEEKKAYYDQHQAEFLRPEQFKLAYVQLSGEKLSESQVVSDEEALAFYNANLGSYGSAEQRKVSHIMIEGKSSDAKKQAEEILTQIKAGGDFTKLAQEKSQDAFSAQQGGQLDWIERGVMDQAFEDAAFTLAKTGDVSDVVESEFGYHIIKLDDVKPSDAKPFAQMRDEVVAQLQAQKANEDFYQLSNSLAEKAFEMPDNLDEAASAINGKIETTDFVSVNNLPSALNNPAVIRALQTPEVREDGLNSELVELAANNVLVVRIEETRPEMVLPFDDVTQQVTDALTRQKAEEALNAQADKILAGLRENNEISPDNSSYKFADAVTIDRNYEDNGLVSLVFAMTASTVDPKTVYEKRTLINGDVTIAALDSVNAPKAITAQELEQLTQSIQTSLVDSDLKALLAQLKETTKVVYTLNNSLN